MAERETNVASARLPHRPVERLARPIERFLHVQAAGGIVLLIATIGALALANSPLADDFRGFWDQRLAIRMGGFALDYPLWYWVNDALMAIFFFVIGLEIKRELVLGELREPKSVVLPALAALGGAAVPVAIYLALMNEPPARDGWAVPMATDIAFVVGALALLGSRVPSGLKIFMLSLAIIDDILAVIVIALFFSSSIDWAALGGAAAGIGLVFVLDLVRVRSIGVYAIAGALVWLLTLKSGVHPTVAGVALGLLTPARPWIVEEKLAEIIRVAAERFRSGFSREERHDPVEDLAFAATESVAPLERLERTLHPWVGFVIMPVFALANAGIAVSVARIGDPVSLAVMAGLVIGKPVGIFGAALLATVLGIARMPSGTSRAALFGASCLGGVGFTMAIFIASLSLEGGGLEAGKTGILVGSAVSLVLGIGLLAISLRPAVSRGAGAV